MPHSPALFRKGEDGRKKKREVLHLFRCYTHTHKGRWHLIGSPLDVVSFAIAADRCLRFECAAVADGCWRCAAVIAAVVVALHYIIVIDLDGCSAWISGLITGVAPNSLISVNVVCLSDCNCFCHFQCGLDFCSLDILVVSSPAGQSALGWPWQYLGSLQLWHSFCICCIYLRIHPENKVQDCDSVPIPRARIICCFSKPFDSILGACVYPPGLGWGLWHIHGCHESRTESNFSALLCFCEKTWTGAQKDLRINPDW